MALTLGIIGYGYMGHWHLRNAPRVEGVSVVAAYDIDPEKVQLARDEGLEAFSSLNEFLASDKINTVLVSTPNDTHCALACAAMKAGKNVIVEKPVAMDGAQAELMARTAQQCGVIFTVHQNR
ncbi:MAG: Gfo/Idh/MocA family protein, partial [Christensenellales bacterium]